jgi:hypothetical protein
MLSRTVLKNPSSMAESFLYHISASRFHLANLLKIRCCTTSVRTFKLVPAGDISHPWEELYKVRTRESSHSETLIKVIDEFDISIVFRSDRRLIINDGENH